MIQGSSWSFAALEHHALTLEREQRFEEAGEKFDAALKLNPASQSCAEGRARVAIALREDSAPEHCARALAFHDSNPERQLRMIETAAAELGSAAIPLFEEYLARHPTDPAAHEMLAEVRAEWDDDEGDSFAESYIAALREYPANKSLLMSYWNTLARARHLEVALESMEANRPLFEGDRDFALLEVNLASHGGFIDRAGKLLDRLDDGPAAQLARGRHRLQTGQPETAAKILEAVVQAEPDNLSAWALLELAWRILGDPRHQWLAGQEGLYDTTPLALTSSELDQIATALRTLHRSRAQPIGQSLRGGTQTPGQLFLRPDVEIMLLTDALTAAIRQFVGALPAGDPHHPLLKHRSTGMAFGPSWSVRFTDGGHHAAHFHPNGILSSACYISVPAAVADANDKAGWLEIGRPPPELGIDLPPLATFEPIRGRLVLFPSFIFHGTRPFSGGERMSVAFDLVPVPAG
jgi:tetratricopeptide (TPR) repeat protein